MIEIASLFEMKQKLSKMDKFHRSNTIELFNNATGLIDFSEQVELFNNILGEGEGFDDDPFTMDHGCKTLFEDEMTQPKFENVNNYGITNYMQLVFISHLHKTKMGENGSIISYPIEPDISFFENIMKLFNGISEFGSLIGYRQLIDESGKLVEGYVVYDHVYFKLNTNYTGSILQIGALDIATVQNARKYITFGGISETQKCSWVFARGNDMIDMDMPVKVSHPSTIKHIPWIADTIEKFEDVDKLCEDYIASKASILILLGPPGTGKTSFINYMISKHKRNPVITYDRNIMTRDDFYIQFLSNKKQDMLILEDADPILQRKQGERSEVLSKILNVGDGLVDITGKKIVITANLESLEELDPAIARKGRCFSVLTSRALTAKEASRLAESEGSSLTYSKEISLAEFYNGENTVKRASFKFGFHSD